MKRPHGNGKTIDQMFDSIKVFQSQIIHIQKFTLPSVNLADEFLILDSNFSIPNHSNFLTSSKRVNSFQ